MNWNLLSWGKLISTTGSLASTVGAKNPYRYRGYRYDTETGLYYLQSRYYNPEFCRMLNADALVGGTGELLGHNMYAYSKNNPVNMSDPSGFRPIYSHGEETEEMRRASLATMRTATIVSRKKKSIKNRIKSAARYAKPLLNKTREILSKKNGTATVGANGSLNFIGGVFKSRALSIDWKGNIAYQVTKGGGGGFPSMSLGAFRAYTNAPDVYKLNGLGAQVGGSLGPVGLELLIPDGGYIGHSESLAFGTCLVGGEVHGEMGTTSTLWDVNVFDLADDVLNSIEEW